MGKQTGSISFEATGGFNSYAKQNYATLSQIKGQFATCETGTNTAAKVATIVPSNTGWGLYPGATVTVKFSNANSATGTLTLNVNGSGAKEIRDYNGNNLEQAARAWSAGAAMALTYDGTYWRIQDSNLIERMHSAETEINQTATSITSLAAMNDTYTKPDGTSGTNSMKTYVDQTATEINTTISGMQTDISNKADGSTVTTLSNTVNNISDTVSGHTQSISSINSTITTKADKSAAIVETTQLWYSKANTTAPNKPTAVVTSTSTDGNAWRVVVPAYNSSYPNYFYCYQWKYADGNYGWSAVTRDIAMGETQERARTAISNAATADGKAVAAQNTANANIKSSVMLWFTKANDTAPNKPTSQVTTANAATGNAWNLIVPTYNAAYPNYFYCYQYQKGNGDYAWSDVIFDCATTESQSTARAASSSLANYITSNNEAMQLLQNQVDGQVEAWYMSVDPTTSNAPASNWSTNEEKARHKGDLYYNITNGHSWRWLENNGTYSWQQIPDSDAAAALAAAQDAQTTANGKRRIFTAQPTTPYDIGDLWVDGSQVKYATIARASGNYVAADWDQTATDDTLAQTAKDVADKNVKESIQLWFTANTTAPNKPTTAVTNNNPTGANSYNKWNIAVPVYNESYKYYFYCYQWKLADGTYDWSSVVYDQATTENQANSRAAKTLAESTQTDYADFKQTMTTFQSTVGTTYATKTELSDNYVNKNDLDTRIEDEDTWLYRTAGGSTDITDGVARIESVKGNTVKWNQLVAESDISTTPYQGITPTKDGGKVTVTGTFNVTSSSRTNFVNVTGLTAGHVYLIKAAGLTKNAGNTGEVVFLDNYTSIGNTATKTAVFRTLVNTSIRFGTFPADGTTTYDLSFYPQIFDLTRMFGAGNEPATVAEFEALFPETYYPYDAGSLLNVNMEGMRTVGFNQWDEEWELGRYDTSTGAPVAANDRIRCKNPVNIQPSTDYCFTGANFVIYWYDQADQYISFSTPDSDTVRTSPSNARYLRFNCVAAYGTTYKHDICINISDPTRNGEYKPYTTDTREIPVSTYFPDGMKSAGSVHDELTATKAVKRVGVVDLGTLDWGLNSSYQSFTSTTINGMKENNYTSHALMCSNYPVKPLPVGSFNYGVRYSGYDANVFIKDPTYTELEEFKSAMSGVMLYYELAEPVETEISPELNLTYKVSDFGTEEIIHTDETAPPILQIQYGVNVIDALNDSIVYSAKLGDRLITLSNTVETTRPLIEQTNTTANDTWTGIAPFETLEDGQEIDFWKIFNWVNSGTTNTTNYWSQNGCALNLTLADGSTTGAIPIWYNGNTRLTSHYQGGSLISMVYKENYLYPGYAESHRVAKGWYCKANYNTDTVYSRSISGGFYTGLNGVLSYGLCMKDENGRWTAIVNNKYSNTTQDKTPYTGGLDPSEILYCSTWYTGGRVATNNTSVSGDLWSSYILDFRFSTNISANSAAGKAMTVRQPVYLVGTFNNKGLFVLDSAQWWTQTIPIATDDKVYIYLGTAYSWYQLALADRNPFYEFKNGKFQEFSLSRISNAETEIIQTKEQIALKANSSDVYTKTSVDGLINTEVTNRNAAITEASNAISLSVSQNYTTKTEFNNLEIGGRNLALQSKTYGSLAKTNRIIGIYGGTKVDYIDGFSAIKGTGNYQGIAIYANSLNLSVGDQITFCVNVKNDSASQTVNFMYAMQFDSSGTRKYNKLNIETEKGVTESDVQGFNTSGILPGEERRIWAKITWTQAAQDLLDANGHLRFTWQCAASNWSNTTVYFWAPKLEKGNHITDWTPAPEDIETRVSSAESAITQNANNISSKVSQTDYTGATVASLINQSADSVKIQANHVEIDGTAVFKAANTVLDTRSTNQPPSWYFSNYPKQTVTEFKNTSTIGLTGETYCYLVTITPWGDASGGYPKQTAQVGAKQYWRVGTAANTWGAWQESETLASTNTIVETAMDELVSRGEQLVINGSAFMGDNTNFSSWTYDGTKANVSGGSFTRNPATSYSMTLRTDDFIPVDESSIYEFSFDALSQNGDARIYGAFFCYDIDGNDISANNVLYVQGSTTTLAQDLKAGDTYVYLTDVSGFDPNGSDVNGQYSRSLIFWDYTNSKGYTYPVETYSRHLYHTNKWDSHSSIDYTNNRIQLKTAYSGTTVPQGTPVSQGNSWSTFEYPAAVNALVPTSWKHYSGLIRSKGIEVPSGQNAFFRAGTAKVKVGFLWNYGGSSSNPQSQIWVTNISLMKWRITSSETIEQTQQIYYRSSSSSAPSGTGLPTTWVTATTDLFATTNTDASKWSLKASRLTANADGTGTKYPYLWTCTQKKTLDGTVSYGTIALDDTTTVIDGGKIITGSIDANAINANTISGSSLTISKFSDADDYLNSNIQVGGRNLLGNTAYLVEGEEYTGKATSAWAGLLPADYIPLLEETTMLDEKYTLSFDARVSGATVRVQWRFNYVSTSGTYKSFSGTYATPIDSTDWHRYYITLPTPSTRPDDYVRSAIIVQSQSGSTTDYVEVRRFKLERGNKPTDWTPAPEDTQASIDSLSDYTNLIRNWYANCATTAGTAAKIATINPETTDFTTSILTPGTVVFVKFATTNSAAVDGLTLNINNTGAKPIRQVRNGTVQNLPGVGYLAADATYQFTYDGANWLYTGNYDSNSNDNARYVQFYNTIVAGEALAAASIIGGRTDGKFYQIKENSSFDLSHPLLWTTAAIAKDATNYANIYTQCYDRTLATFYTSFTNTTANCIVYLVGTVNGNTFTTYGSNSSQYLTINPPTTADGRFYIPIGRLGNQSNGKNYFNYQVGMPVTLYAFVDKKFRQVTPTEIVATQRVYYRSKVSGTFADAYKPTAWVTQSTDKYNENTSTANGWSTKVTPIAASKDVDSSGRYLYLYTCEQRKRLDGTIEHTDILLDDSTTIIDGGNIITGSVTTNSLTAYNAEIGKISADALEITGSAVFTAINEDTSETTINGGKIQAQSITVDRIATGDLTGEHGAINLHEGTFNFTDPETGKGIIWDGEDLYVRGNVTLSYQDIEDVPTSISDFEDANTYVTTDSLSNQLGGITSDISEISGDLDSLSTQVGGQNDALNTLNSDMSTATNNISALQNASNEYAEQFRAINSFTTIRPGEVEMGLAESPVRMFLTATGLKFQTMAQQQPIAYLGVDNSTGVGKLYVTNAVVVQDMELGEWAWTARKNKHLTLKYIGS